jgi:PRTRC genetic system protein C
MAATILEAIRIFRHSGRDLPDPDLTMTPDEVLTHYAKQYPKLLGGKVVGPTIEGDAHVYELRASFGEKG